MLALEQLRTDGGTQSRERLDQDRIDEYAEHVTELPPVVVFYDGEVYWLADGYHRRAAFEKAGRKRIPVEVRQGSQRDALWYSLGANREHDKAGLARTKGDRTRAIKRALEDEEWRALSAAVLAEHIGVHRSYVIKIKGQLTTSSQLPPQPTTGKDGKTRKPPKARTPKADEASDPPEAASSDDATSVAVPGSTPAFPPAPAEAEPATETDTDDPEDEAGFEDDALDDADDSELSANAPRPFPAPPDDNSGSALLDYIEVVFHAVYDRWPAGESTTLLQQTLEQWRETFAEREATQ